MRNVGKRPAVHKGRRVFQRLHQVGLKGVFQQRRHGALGVQLPGRDRLAAVSIAHHNAGKALFQVGKAGGKAENSHHFACHRDVKAILARRAVHLAAKAVHQKAQLAVVHIYTALPGDAARVNAKGVAVMDMVIHHGGQQVVGRADGVQIAREVQVDVLHGHHLGIAAARGAALDAKHGAKAWLAQRKAHVFAHAVQRVGKAYAGGGFALARGRGADGRNQNHLGGRLFFGHHLCHNFCLCAAVGNHRLLRDPHLLGHLQNGGQNGLLGNLDISFHMRATPFHTGNIPGLPPCASNALLT